MLSIYRLPNKLPGEIIIKIVRRDFFILFKRMIVFMLMAVLPFAFFYLMITTNLGLLESEIIYPIIVLSTSAYYLFTWLFFFFSFIDYYLDVWIITDKRIIDIQQRGFFSRIISELKIFRIQDVTSEIQGAIPTLLKYGEVFIQTAGTDQRFKFHEVPDPNGIRDIIIKLIQKNRIEQKPAKPRDHSRLLVLHKNSNKLEHKHFYEIIDYLQRGDILILNNSKVIPARLIGTKEKTAGKVEIFLHHHLKNNLWQCLIGGKRVYEGLKINFSKKLNCKIIKNNNDGTWDVEFNCYGNVFIKVLKKIGQTPLPPYIKRSGQTKEDKIDYQTIYADKQK